VSFIAGDFAKIFAKILDSDSGPCSFYFQYVLVLALCQFGSGLTVGWYILFIPLDRSTARALMNPG
jgi:hypothetical protein